MRAIDRKLLRNLGTLKGQVATIAVVVACGIASFVTMQTAWSSLSLTRSTYYERYRFADVFASLERAPLSLLDQIREIPGVSVAYGRVVHYALLPMPGDPEPATAQLISIPDRGDPPLCGVYVRAGRLPEPGRTDEVAILEAFAKAHSLDLGDSIPAVINGTLRRLTVVGIAMSPEYVFAARPGDISPDDKRFAVAWISRSVLAPALEMEGAFNDVILSLQPGASRDAVIDRLDTLLDPYGGTGAYGADKQMSNLYISSELDGLERMATAIPFIFLAVAAFLLNVVLARLVSLQRTQIAVLKAIGYSNWQVGRHFLALVAVIVAGGAVLGVGLGAWLGKLMTGVYTDYFRFPILAYRVDPGVVAIGVAVCGGAALSGSLLAIRGVVRLPPAEAMRPPAPPTYTISLFDRIGFGKVLGTSAMMVLRDLRRRPLRAMLSSLGIAAAIGIMVVGRFSYDSFEYLVSGPMRKQSWADLTVQFSRPVPARAARELEHLPGVIAAEGQRTVAVRLIAGHRERRTVISSVGAPPLLRRVVDREGRTLDISRGLGISRILGERLHLARGDPVDVEILEGRKRTFTLYVDRLVDDAFGLQAYLPVDRLHRLLDQEPAYSSIDLMVDPLEREAVFRRLQKYPNVALVTRAVDLIERFEEQSGSLMLVMTVILAMFAGAIAVGVVYNNARVALSTRSRDLASLRVLGFTRGEISAVLLGELAIHMAVAIPLGLALGTWWSHAIMAASADPEMYRLPVIISARSYAFAVVVALVAGVVSALLVRRKLDRLDLIGVLKTRG